MKDLRMYILVNSNIDISKAKLSGQVGHSANVLTYRMCKENSPLIHEYMLGSIKKIILSCPQKKLEELENLGYVTIRDNGLTELEPNTLTCTTVGILDKNNIPEELKFIKRLRLL